MTIKPELFTRAVDCLLRPDNSLSLRRIQDTVRQDPEYLQYHSASVSLEIIRMLLKDTATSGIPYDSDLIVEILEQALKRLDSL